MTTPALDRAVADATRGDAPDAIALMRILGQAVSDAEARSAIAAALGRCAREDDASGAAVLRRLEILWKRHPDAWAVVRSTVTGIAHDALQADPDAMLRYWCEAFDRLAVASPEASVALYSLGSADLLAATTAEIVALMQRLALLGPDRDALDLGCGIGRFLVALAPHLHHVSGVDISARMVAEAQSRCAGLFNVNVTQSQGRDLAFASDASLDLVLAVDVFPYLVGAGLAEAHVFGFGRVLRPGGAALILNYSYRGDPDQDRRDVAAAAGRAGLAVERSGTRDLSLWDGATFLLRRSV